MTQRNDLSEDIKTIAVNHLKNKLNATFFDGMKEEYDKDNNTWWAKGGWHFRQGMQIRNLLRNVITDDKLPSGNWDDYYILILEKAAGLK